MFNESMSDYQFKFPELFQFFGGYFYQGWAADYRWENLPNFASVVRHFKALNPPSTVNRVINEIEDLLAQELPESDLAGVLGELGNNYLPTQDDFDDRIWLESILRILRESSTAARVLREKN